MKGSLPVLALVAISIGVPLEGQVNHATSTRATLASVSECGHYTAVCGGIYGSVLPNCSGGPDVYDLDVPAGVHIVAEAPPFVIEDSFPIEIRIIEPSGAEGATGTNLAEYTTTASGVHKIVVSASQAGHYGLTVACSPNPSCTASPTVLCLNNDRFAVTTMWRTETGSGSGTAAELTGDTGYFWFFNPENVEVVAKVLNGCALTNAYWVFAGGLTNVDVVLTVVDTQTGVGAFYVRSAGPAFDPVQDTGALETCP